jgi:hypothetical protein
VTGRAGVLASARSELALDGSACRRARTRSLHRRPPARPVSRRAQARAGFAVVLGTALLVLAVPRVVSAFWLWLRGPAMDL